MTQRISLEDSHRIIKILEAQKEVLIQAIGIAEELQLLQNKQTILATDELQEQCVGLLNDMEELCNI